jgi:hypothetical protein
MPTGSASEGNSAIANLGSTTQNLITGTLFNDDLVSGKNNGIGFAGWEVFIDTNGNGKEDSDEPFTETDENGQYTFDDLSPGKYTVMAKIGDSEFASTTPIARSINLTHGESATLDFGFAQIIPLSGTVYDDLNGDGELSSADKPLAHITLFCDLNNNGKLDPGEPSAVSSSKGRYTIEGIGGRPVITAVTPAGLRQEPFDERNVLLTPTAAIKVEPFHDPNRNGKQDAGEHAENYLVDLLQADVSERGGSGWHDPTQPFYFDGDGFAGFAPGTYRIKFGIISPPIHPTHSEFVLTLKAGQVTDIMLGVVGL